MDYLVDYEIIENFIKNQKEKSGAVYYRALSAFNNNFIEPLSIEKNRLRFTVTDRFDDFDVEIELAREIPSVKCACESDLECCHHALSSLIFIKHNKKENNSDGSDGPYTLEEMKSRVIGERRERASIEKYNLIPGENIFGPHELVTDRMKRYNITIRDFDKGTGHCACEDFRYNKLGTCKHLMHAHEKLKERFSKAHKEKKERYPYIEIYCDPLNGYRIACYRKGVKGAEDMLDPFFGENNYLDEKLYPEFLRAIGRLEENKKILIRPEVKDLFDGYFEKRLLGVIEKDYTLNFSKIKGVLYEYQKAGISFSLFKKGAVIADEMGLGKTLQAISIAVFKREIFEFKRCLIITPSSLKHQWKNEIERFTDETAIIVEGKREGRRDIYKNWKTYFMIANYEAIMRDITILQEHPPDFIILDEAQRIKNYQTKTADAVKSIPKKHSLVITGTPLENNLIELYSIIQFIDKKLLSPLWEFSMNYCLFDKMKKNKITGYYNLQHLKERIKDAVIRREKREVLSELPPIRELTVPIELTNEQAEIHAGYARIINMILRKKFITLSDLQKLQQLLLLMRMVCDSTYLIDRETNISPKLAELEEILINKLDLANNKRKVIIFSEWKEMLKLISHRLAKLDLGHVVFSGDVAVNKRGKIIEEFEKNDNCRIFLSTEAGGAGLNLQVADTVINFEVPWNPAKKNQRTGRIDRIGQKAGSLLVINFITQNSIEVNIASGLVLKQNLFDAVLKEDSKDDFVDFSKKGKATFFNQLKDLIRGLDEEPYGKEASEDIDSVFKTEPITDAMTGELEDPVGSIPAPGEEQNLHRREVEGTADKNEQSEILEKTLNRGLDFLSGIMQMATGKGLDAGGKSITVDRETGEVTMKFKLPEF